MKNYNEIANDLFERRDKCIAEQKARRKTITRITTSVCSFILVALLGIGVWQSGLFNYRGFDRAAGYRFLDRYH